MTRPPTLFNPPNSPRHLPKPSNSAIANKMMSSSDSSLKASATPHPESLMYRIFRGVRKTKSRLRLPGRQTKSSGSSAQLQYPGPTPGSSFTHLSLPRETPPTSTSIESEDTTKDSALDTCGNLIKDGLHVVISPERPASSGFPKFQIMRGGVYSDRFTSSWANLSTKREFRSLVDDPYQGDCVKALNKFLAEDLEINEANFNELFSFSPPGPWEDFESWTTSGTALRQAIIAPPSVKSTRGNITRTLAGSPHDCVGVFNLFGSTAKLRIGHGRQFHWRMSFMLDDDWWDPWFSTSAQRREESPPWDWLSPQSENTKETYEMMMAIGEPLAPPHFALCSFRDKTDFFGVQLGYLEYSPDLDPEEASWTRSGVVFALGGTNASHGFDGVYLVNPSALHKYHSKDQLRYSPVDDLPGLANAPFALLSETLDAVGEDYEIRLKPSSNVKLRVYRAYYDNVSGTMEGFRRDHWFLDNTSDKGDSSEDENDSTEQDKDIDTDSE